MLCAWNSAVNKTALVSVFMELSLAGKTYIKQMLTMEENLPVDKQGQRIERLLIGRL